MIHYTTVAMQAKQISQLTQMLSEHQEQLNEYRTTLENQGELLNNCRATQENQAKQLLRLEQIVLHKQSKIHVQKAKEETSVKSGGEIKPANITIEELEQRVDDLEFAMLDVTEDINDVKEDVLDVSADVVRLSADILIVQENIGTFNFLCSHFFFKLNEFTINEHVSRILQWS